MYYERNESNYVLKKELFHIRYPVKLFRSCEREYVDIYQATGYSSDHTRRRKVINDEEIKMSVILFKNESRYVRKISDPSVVHFKKSGRTHKFQMIIFW